ncbi:DoxX family protein [Candidatus Woesearchaeota archaeon]|nr:DoxX family protein [Candidatus Woesearchaeota archaeon]
MEDLLQEAHNRKKFFYKETAPAAVRLGISFVVLWFGISQLANPGSWLGYLPSWSSALPIQPESLVFLNGMFETIVGLLLILGFLTRIAAGLAGLHILAIAFSLGYNDVAVRDIGLSVMAFAAALYGPDKYCLERILRKQKTG